MFIVITGVPDTWHEAFYAHGFHEYAVFQDYWLEKIPPGIAYGDYEFLRMDDCSAASEITAACRGQSRGFEGETPEWFALWLHGKEEGQINSECKNPAILVHRENKKIVGIACAATYAHNNDKKRKC